MADGLVTLGVDAVATDDGIRIQGGEIGSGEVESFDDRQLLWPLVLPVFGLVVLSSLKRLIT